MQSTYEEALKIPGEILDSLPASKKEVDTPLQPGTLTLVLE